MRTVVAIDTSTPTTARLAVVRGQTVVSEDILPAHRSHNALLFEPLGKALAVVEPDVIAVGTGPGSYVGIRIAIAAALGIAMVKCIPVVGVPSLLCLSPDGAGDEPVSAGSELTVVGDARRGQVWLAQIEGDRMSAAPVILAPDDARKRIEAIGRAVVTPDAIAPLEGISARQVAPSATLLAKRVACMANSEFGKLCKDAVFPIYLAAPFVTTPRK